MGKKPKRSSTRRSRSEIPKKRRKTVTNTRSSSEFSPAACKDSSNNNPGSGTKILANPIRSPLDEKEYRVVELVNGLRAVLISYMPCNEDQAIIKQNRNCLDQRIIEFNSRVVGVEVSDASKQERPRSSCSVEAKPSKRSLQARKRKHKANCRCRRRPAAITLTVGTGSFLEPKDLLGSAHLLEHVVINGGSAKYPDSRFLYLIYDHDVQCYNATTRGSETSYYFQMPYRQMPNVIDQYANLFVYPSLGLNIIQNERRAVDSEYLDKKFLDARRVLRMSQLCMKEGHPASTFRVGSLKTLTTPDGKDETLQKRLREYFDKDYGANNITLAIQAPDTLDSIQCFVEKYFEQIPRRSGGMTTPDFQNPNLAADLKKFARFYSIIPVHTMKTLSVSWDLPLSAVRDCQAKPIFYLTNLILSGCPGGLLNYLQTRRYVSSINCYTPDIFDHNHTSVLFRIGFHLVSCEMEIVFKILETLFSYLNFLKTIGPQEWYFNELRWIQALQFHFTCNDYNSMTNTKLLALFLRYYEPKDCVISSELATKWDPESISSCLKLLTPSSANVMFISKEAADCTLQEHYYKVKYGVKDICSTWINKWTTIRPFQEFKFPCPNRFITTSFCDPTCSDLVDQQLGKKIKVISDEKIEIFNKKSDTEYATYEVSLMTAVPLFTRKNWVLREIWTYIMFQLLHPRLHGARQALVTYKIGYQRKNNCITFEVHGFSQHLHVVIEEILQQIQTIEMDVNRELFENSKAAILALHEDELLQPDDLSELVMTSIFKAGFQYRYSDFKNPSMTAFKDFQNFAVTLKEKLNVKVMAKGDVDKDASLRLADTILNTLTYCPLSDWDDIVDVDMPIRNRGRQFPLGRTILRLRTRNLKCNKSFISTTYQIHEKHARTKKICNFISKILCRPAHNYLRRMENLGYGAGGLFFSDFGVSHIGLYVNSHSCKFTATFVTSKIQEFVQLFYENDFRGLAEKKMSKYLKGVTLQEIIEIYRKYLLPCRDSEMRNITIQVVGPADKEFTEEFNQDLSAIERRSPRPKKQKNSSLPFTVLAPINYEQSSGDVTYVTNILEFASKLFLYPLSCSTKR